MHVAYLVQFETLLTFTKIFRVRCLVYSKLDLHQKYLKDEIWCIIREDKLMMIGHKLLLSFCLKDWWFVPGWIVGHFIQGVGWKYFDGYWMGLWILEWVCTSVFCTMILSVWREKKVWQSVMFLSVVRGLSTCEHLSDRAPSSVSSLLIQPRQFLVDLD